MLGIDSEAGIEVTKSIANSGAIYVPVSESLTVTEGRLRDDLYLTIGGFDARIGRLADNTLDANEWLLSSLDDNFFEMAPYQMASVKKIIVVQVTHPLLVMAMLCLI